MKSLATSMLLLWALCWAHCSLSRYGAVQGSDACTCCSAAAEHAEDSHHDEDGDHHRTPAHTAVDCGVCDFLTHGSTLMQKLPPLTALAVDASPLAIWEPAPLPVLTTASFTQAPSHDPPPRQRPLCEVLTRTACPVRGPSLA